MASPLSSRRRAQPEPGWFFGRVLERQIAMFVPFFEWIESTAFSTGIRESIMLYPIIETSHVLTLCLFLGLISMWDLRLLGLTLKTVRVSDMEKRILPWGQAGFVLMVITGLLLFISTPVRASQNIFFQVKMAMFVLAGLNAMLFHVTVYKQVENWDTDVVLPSKARMAGYLSVFLWAGVVVCGRMQAYNWFD